jgi:hypothetical protein
LPYEWQDVPDGMVLPTGLEVEMNLETGKNRARLRPDDQKPVEASSGKRRNGQLTCMICKDPIVKGQATVPCGGMPGWGMHRYCAQTSD